MAYSLNKVCILGNVGKDPEIKNLQNGAKLANLTVATEESWVDKSSGERKKRTEWHRITVWNPGLAGVIEKHVHKGTKVYVEGALETRKWQAQDGTDRYSTEIVLRAFGGELIILGDKSGGDSRDDRPARQPERTDARGNPSWNAPSDQDLDDAIPF